MIRFDSKQEFHCPLCGCITGKIIHSYNSKDSAIHMYGDEDMTKSILITSLVAKLWDKNNCHFISCDNCFLTYAKPFIAGDAAFYQMLYDKSSGYTKWKWEFQKTYEAISKIIASTSISTIKLLEIGAGNGNFLKKILKTNIQPNNILATEYSSYGKKEIERLGIRCLDSKLLNSKTSNEIGRFDIICMFQVLEHLDNLDEVFQSLSYLSKEHCHLFIAVPNNYHREFFENLGVYEDVPPIHITRWHQQSFIYMANKYGWEIIGYKIEPNKIHKNIVKYIKYKYRHVVFINKLDALQNKYVRIFIKAIVLFPLLLLNIKKCAILSNKKLGITQLVHFQKQ